MIGVAFGVIALAGILMLVFIVSGNQRKSGHSRKKYATQTTDYNPHTVKIRWAEIQTMLSTPSGVKNALIEADKLLDYVLKGRGYSGETMAERLKKAEVSFRDKDSVWRAHKLRNAIAHDVDHDLVVPQVTQSIHTLGAAIKDLEAQL